MRATVFGLFGMLAIAVAIAPVASAWDPGPSGPSPCIKGVNAEHCWGYCINIKQWCDADVCIGSGYQVPQCVLNDFIIIEPPVVCITEPCP